MILPNCLFNEVFSTALLNVRLRMRKSFWIIASRGCFEGIFERASRKLAILLDILILRLPKSVGISIAGYLLLRNAVSIILASDSTVTGRRSRDAVRHSQQSPRLSAAECWALGRPSRHTFASSSSISAAISCEIG